MQSNIRFTMVEFYCILMVPIANLAWAYLLLQKNTALNIRHYKYTMPLYKACEKIHLEIVEYLLRKSI